MDGSDDNAARAPEIEIPPAVAVVEEPYVSPVPGCILLAVGALMVLLLAVGWLI